MDPLIAELLRRVNEEGDEEAIAALLELSKAGNEEAMQALLWSDTPASQATRRHPREITDSLRAANPPLQADPFQKIMELASMLMGGAEPASANAVAPAPTRIGRSPAQKERRAQTANPSFISYLAGQQRRTNPMARDAGPAQPDSMPFDMDALLGEMIAAETAADSIRAPWLSLSGQSSIRDPMDRAAYEDVMGRLLELYHAQSGRGQAIDRFLGGMTKRGR